MRVAHMDPAAGCNCEPAGISYIQRKDFYKQLEACRIIVRMILTVHILSMKYVG